MEISELYNNWIKTAIRPSPDDCPLSAEECLLKGKPCTLRHIPIISEEEYFQRKLFGELVASQQRFREKYPLEEAQYQKPYAFDSLKAKKQYLQDKKDRDFNHHLINDHTLQSYDVPCEELLTENCKLLGYVAKPENPYFVQKCKKIKKYHKIKKDHSFMDEALGFGKHWMKTWRQVEKYHPSYLDWGVKQFKEDQLKRYKASIIISKRSMEQRKKMLEQMKKDQSFMNMELGFGNYKLQTWGQVESRDPGYINSIAKFHKGTDNGDFAKIIIKNRKKVKTQVKTQ